MSVLLENTSVADRPKWYGVTDPISLDLPSEADLRQTKNLTHVLQSCNIFGSDSDFQHREKVVKNLEALYKEWLRDTCRRMNMPECVTDQVGGRVVPFGSFTLGAYTGCSDVDVLCVGPCFIERHDFFSSFYEKMKSLREVQGILAIEEAFVPVIKLNFDGIPIDLVYAQVQGRESIPDGLDLLDTKLLHGMDPQSIRSLQGYRVTVEILSLVPNVHNFRLALRTIKHWAKCRNIYSNKLGFLGGVAWCILMARTCQLYPHASAATLVAKFFRVFSTWGWPLPIMLRHPEEYPYNLPVWDPRVNPRDGFHRMPIITPAYPYQNSAYNTTASTLNVMRDELKRGRGITEAVYENRASWRKLFEPPNFVQDYGHYIVLTATAATQTQQQQWAAFVESRIRLLVGKLDRNVHISLAHPSMKTFRGKDGLSKKWLIGVKLNQYGPQTLNLAPDLLTFTQIVYSHSGSLYKEGMEVSAAYTNCQNLSSLLLDSDIPDAGRSNSKAPAKRRACSPVFDRHPKKVRVDQTSGNQTWFSASNRESAVAAGVSEKRPSTKRHWTPEHNPEAKRFKQELRPSPVELSSQTPAHTRPVAVRRPLRANFFQTVQRRE